MSTAPTAYDYVVDKLAQHEQKPYAMRLGRRDWSELRKDPRTLKELVIAPGDHISFMGVPVRFERGRISRIPRKFHVEVYETAEQLHEAIYGA